MPKYRLTAPTFWKGRLWSKRQVGDVFDLPEGSDPPPYFEPLEAPAEKPKEDAKGKKAAE